MTGAVHGDSGGEKGGEVGVHSFTGQTGFAEERVSGLSPAESQKPSQARVGRTSYSFFLGCPSFRLDLLIAYPLLRSQLRCHLSPELLILSDLVFLQTRAALRSSHWHSSILHILDVGGLLPHCPHCKQMTHILPTVSAQDLFPERVIRFLVLRKESLIWWEQTWGLIIWAMVFSLLRIFLLLFFQSDDVSYSVWNAITGSHISTYLHISASSLIWRKPFSPMPCFLSCLLLGNCLWSCIQQHGRLYRLWCHHCRGLRHKVWLNFVTSNTMLLNLCEENIQKASLLLNSYSLLI